MTPGTYPGLRGAPGRSCHAALVGVDHRTGNGFLALPLPVGWRAEEPPMPPSARRLSPDQLRWTCPELECESLDPASTPFLGQERAIRSLRLGMEIQAPGYHIFVSGLTGTGRGSTVKQLLRDLQTECRAVPDRCFVHDPNDPWRPMLLSFEAGQGQRFQEDVGQFGRELLGSLPRTLASAALNSRRQAIRDAHQAQAAAAQAQLVESCQGAWAHARDLRGERRAGRVPHLRGGGGRARAARQPRARGQAERGAGQGARGGARAAARAAR